MNPVIDTRLHGTAFYICPMKSLICLFLSLYVLMLSVLPCADGYLELRPGYQSVSVAADQHQQASDAPVDDHCSPFCGCACCGTVADQPPLFGFSLSVPVPLADYGPRAISSAPISVFLPTWQPPQLS